jgi:hypothetical protein
MILRLARVKASGCCRLASGAATASYGHAAASRRRRHYRYGWLAGWLARATQPLRLL